MFHAAPSLLAALFASQAVAHFIMQDPKPIGSTDATQSDSPCGGFDPSDRTNEVAWPVGGRAIYMISTHIESTWAFRAALINDTSNWLDLGPQIYQQGYGHICLPNAPGVEEWVGEDGVVQIIQDAAHGVLYQCVAVKFVDGDATGPSDGCKNSTDIQAVFTTTSTATATMASSTGDLPEATATTSGGDSSGDQGSAAGSSYAFLVQTALLVCSPAAMAAVVFMI